jgi:hypothetical protein
VKAGLMQSSDDKNYTFLDQHDVRNLSTVSASQISGAALYNLLYHFTISNQGPNAVISNASPG